MLIKSKKTASDTGNYVRFFYVSSVGVVLCRPRVTLSRAVFNTDYNYEKRNKATYALLSFISIHYRNLNLVCAFIRTIVFILI